MEIVKYLCEFFFTGWGGFLHWIMLVILFRTLSPKINKGNNYNFDWKKNEEN